ncbi:MAG: hypothetical protein QXN95_03775 [Candidatus Bathyarchaeia archaeon]
MNVRIDVKAVSTLLTIILIIISAIIGGIVSYAFTIAYYTKKPEGTTLTITGVYINKEDATRFTISVLNPSYSPTDAKISRIAISLEGETQLYDVVETDPPLKNGIVVPIGESKNITCIKMKKENTNVTLGQLIGSYGFAGKTIIVHVFSPDSTAANMQTKLPFVQLGINVNFNPRISVKKCNITLTNNPQSEVNVTVNDIEVWGAIDTKMDPNVRVRPITIPARESADFRLNISWLGVSATLPLIVYTEQGYVFRKELELKGFSVSIKSVDFSEEDTSHFNVTIFNFAESVSHANITTISCKLDNGTYLNPFECGSVGIMPNTSLTFKFEWGWKEYRGRKITITAYFLQDFSATLNITTPSPIIVNASGSIFDLKNRGYFNITILNHISSLESINITQIKIKKTGQILNRTTEVSPQLPYGPIAPGESKALNCTFDWANYIKNYNDRNLTLIINVVSNTTPSGNYSFDFTFILPVAELNATVQFETGETSYINATIVLTNLEYSLWNLTLSEVILTVNASTDLFRYKYVFPEDEVINVGGNVVLLFALDKQKCSGNTLTLTVFTEELGEVKIPLSWLIP